MTRQVSMAWNLRQLMAARGMFQTTDLLGPLAEHGIEISRQMVHRIVTKAPQRINLDLLAALCDILGCTAADLLEVQVAHTQPARRAVGETGPAIGTIRPVPAKVRRPDGVE